VSADDARKRLLVVEDDLDTQSTMLETLELFGYAAIGASDGREALEVLADGDLPDLILLDLMMPIMNGWQFREEQMKQPRLAAIPVVVTSADRDAERTAATLGAAAVLVKPMQLQVLLETLARCTGSNPR
jgi:CheY-like chemotaxis protein